METCDLLNKRCVPCEGGVPKLGVDRIGVLHREISHWSVRDEKLLRTFEFKDFVGAMRFVNRMADLAEAEGHHPNFSIDYNKVNVTIWTHAIGGLSENDFILAAKIDTIV